MQRHKNRSRRTGHEPGAPPLPSSLRLQPALMSSGFESSSKTAVVQDLTHLTCSRLSNPGSPALIQQGQIIQIRCFIDDEVNLEEYESDILIRNNKQLVI